eukprot:TRINITY_DN23332_c0_g1_i1.p1 TRINITY_DN23332_c0_g1~~TRINITY_DN23332_c0_g1_i1.p1  ORF type:complete len:442 (+),score=27.41 TRINITY_DN23332_c0_g1_i1:514-1839(+)
MCIIVPIFVKRALQSGIHVHKHAIYYVDIDEKLPFWLIFIIGKGEWVSTRKQNHFAQRYTSVLRAYNTKRCWFVVNEFACMFMLAGAMVLHTDTYVKCGHVRMFCGCVNMVFCGIDMFSKPHTRPRDAFIDPWMFSLQGVALIFMGIGYYTEDLTNWCFAVSSSLFMGASMVLLLKMILDTITALYVLVKDRRGKLQQKVWTQSEMDLHMPEFQPVELETLAPLEHVTEGSSADSLSLSQRLLPPAIRGARRFSHPIDSPSVKSTASTATGGAPPRRKSRRDIRGSTVPPAVLVVTGEPPLLRGVYKFSPVDGAVAWRCGVGKRIIRLPNGGYAIQCPNMTVQSQGFPDGAANGDTVFPHHVSVWNPANAFSTVEVDLCVTEATPSLLARRRTVPLGVSINSSPSSAAPLGTPSSTAMFPHTSSGGMESDQRSATYSKLDI